MQAVLYQEGETDVTETKESKNRCVITLPLLTEPYQEHIIEKRFKILEHLQNSLIAMELRKLKNIQRTRAYRELEQSILQLPKEKRRSLYQQRRQMLEKAGFSRNAFKDDITPMQKHFVGQIATHVAHHVASDVWRAFDKHLYHGAKKVHFKHRGTLSSAANQTAGNAMSMKDDMFIWSGGQSKDKITLRIRVQKPDTDYERDMLQKKVKYFRVVRKWVKTRYKYYLQLTLVGEPAARHRPIGEGRVGIDIGTQSVAIVSAEQAHLWELADRVNANHEKMLRLQRKMDSSRRSMNPENYNEDGTIRRGIRLRWIQSNRYRKLAGQIRELQRKNADIRKYQHVCLANYILTLGSEIYVEDMDYRAMQRRAKKTEKNKHGRFKRKKRFGKSLANKAPSMFLTILDTKLQQATGSGLRRVNKWSFRASQYDHLSQKYTRKTLGTRNFTLDNGDHVQRDLYAAFLIMNADATLSQPDQQRCEQTYPAFIILHNQELNRIQAENKPHLSSFGIA